MIKVSVEQYCDDCRDFLPSVTYPQRIFCDNNHVLQTDTIIFCEHRDRCRAIAKFMEKKNERLLQEMMSSVESK